MNLAPIDCERKIFKKVYDMTVLPVSVFITDRGTVQLFMDDKIVYSITYNSRKIRANILKEWEMWMKNMYKDHVFYVHIIPKMQP